MPTRTTAPTGSPCWIDISSSDQARTEAFYGELFGWTVDDPGPDYGGYKNFLKDGVQVAGCMKAMDGGPDTWGIYLATPDAQAVVDAATARGGQVIVPAMAVMSLGTMAIVTDPGGAVVGAWQPGEHTGFGVYDEPGTPGWFELHTPDYEATVAFYRDVFAWDAHTMSDTPEFRYTTYGEGDGALAGIMDASTIPEGATLAWSIYFRVDDTDKAVARAEELGATVVQAADDTPYGRLAKLTDPLGAHFKLVG